MALHGLALRAIPAALIAAAVFVSLGAALAAGDRDPPATPIEVAQPRMGDRVVYTATLTGDWPFELPDDAVDGTYDALWFEWQPGRAIRDAHGVMQETDALRVQERSPTLVTTPGAAQDGARQRSWTWGQDAATAYLEAGRDRFVASESIARGGADATGSTSVAGVPVLANEGNTTYDTRMLRVADDQVASCLVLHGAQARTLHKGESFQLAPACAFAGLLLTSNVTVVVEDIVDAGRPAARLVARDVEALDLGAIAADFGDFVVFEERLVDVELLVGDLAYPLEVSWSIEGRRAVLRLAGFEPGGVDRAPVPPLGEGPQPVLADRPRWTLDDTGVTHPLPLSRAFQHAATDPRSPLPAFLQDHPDAYVSYAWDTGDGSVSWWMGVTGGTETLTFVMRESPMPPCLGDLCLEADVPVYQYTDFGRSASMAPPASALPAQAPTVASLLDIWEAYGDPSYAGLPPTYGFRVECDFVAQAEGRGCVPVILAEAGHGVLRTETSPEASGTPGLRMGMDWRRSLLSQSPDGLFFIEFDATVQYTSGPAPLASPEGIPQPGPAEPPAASILASSLLPPTLEQAGGVGLLSLLVGAAYWLWPSLKGSALALFSRHTADQVLQHPQRARLAQIVAANPGIQFSELRRIAGVANGTLVHHVGVLERTGHLRRVAAHGQTRFFPAGAPAIVAGPPQRSPGGTAVLEAIRSKPGLSNLEVARRTGLDPGTVHYHVQRLVQSGLVHVERQGRQVQLRPGGASAGA